MKFYDLNFLTYISQKYGSQYSRALEIGLLAGISYLLGVFVTGQIFSTNGLIVAVITPIWAAINKYLRDADQEKLRAQGLSIDLSAGKGAQSENINPNSEL